MQISIVRKMWGTCSSIVLAPSSLDNSHQFWVCKLKKAGNLGKWMDHLSFNHRAVSFFDFFCPFPISALWRFTLRSFEPTRCRCYSSAWYLASPGEVQGFLPSLSHFVPLKEFKRSPFHWHNMKNIWICIICCGCFCDSSHSLVLPNNTSDNALTLTKLKSIGL